LYLKIAKHGWNSYLFTLHFVFFLFYFFFLINIGNKSMLFIFLFKLTDEQKYFTRNKGYKTLNFWNKKVLINPTRGETDFRADCKNLINYVRKVGYFLKGSLFFFGLWTAAVHDISLLEVSKPLDSRPPVTLI
jgi:hypothetical protein